MSHQDIQKEWSEGLRIEVEEVVVVANSIQPGMHRSYGVSDYLRRRGQGRRSPQDMTFRIQSYEIEVADPSRHNTFWVERYLNLCRM